MFKTTLSSQPLLTYSDNPSIYILSTLPTFAIFLLISFFFSFVFFVFVYFCGFFSFGVILS